MIAIDICKVSYQTLLTTYLKVIKKNARYAKKNQIKLKCDFIGLENNRLHYKCKEWGKRCTKSINGLIKKFPRIYQFCGSDHNKFVLLLRIYG